MRRQPPGHRRKSGGLAAVVALMAVWAVNASATAADPMALAAELDGRQIPSTATTVADVVSVEPRANISVGEGVCQYGRFSNSQDCTLDVFDVSLACTLGGVFNDRLVQMSAITSVPGDSGGPWFLAGRAYGSQKGWCGNKDTFSVAELFDEALGVTVMTN